MLTRAGSRETGPGEVNGLRRRSVSFVPPSLSPSSPAISPFYWCLVPVLMVLSTPFIHALSHAQNTCTSLLLLTLVVLAWRAERGFVAGLLAGLLLYKPQLGAILIVILVITLGWRPLAGLAVTGTFLLLVMLLTMPGTLSLWLHQMPANLHFVIDQTPYLWDRHVTFKAFWRLLLQGRAAGSPTPAVRMLTFLSSGAMALLLLLAAIRTRIELPRRKSQGTRLDPIIAATIACTPLIMPFYFDYDQLLLAIPAVLFAAERLRFQSALRSEVQETRKIDRWLPGVWACWYAWLMINPDVALKTHVNLTVVLLSGVAGLMLVRAVSARLWPGPPLQLSDERRSPNACSCTGVSHEGDSSTASGPPPDQGGRTCRGCNCGADRSERRRACSRPRSSAVAGPRSPPLVCGRRAR